MNKRSGKLLVGASVFFAMTSIGFAASDQTVKAIEKDLLKVVDELASNGVTNRDGVLRASNQVTIGVVQPASYSVPQPDSVSGLSDDKLLLAMANLTLNRMPERRQSRQPVAIIRPAKRATTKKASINNAQSADSIKLTPAIYRSVMNGSADIAPRVGKKGKSKSKRSYRRCYNWGYQELQRKASRYQKSITEASLRYGVSEHLIKSVITAESCFKSRARSRKGARGLMQLMPATARRFGVRRSYNPHQNIMGGTKYLRWLLDRFQGNLHKVLAGYNAGEGRVIRYGGIPPFRETIEYVRRVLGVYKTLQGKRAVSYNETHGHALARTRADYQRIWKQNQQRSRQQRQFRLVRASAPTAGASQRPDQRRCDKAVPPHLMSISYLKRSGRGGSTWSRYYKVRKGETLADIMRKSGVHINSLKRLNRHRTQFVAGQPVLLWECKA